jgi:hypothetical protein
MGEPTKGKADLHVRVQAPIFDRLTDESEEQGRSRSDYTSAILDELGSQRAGGTLLDAARRGRAGARPVGRTIWVDYQGTVHGNASVDLETIHNTLLYLKTSGVRVVVWTGGNPDNVNETVRALVSGVMEKDNKLPQAGDVVVDDSDPLLKSIQRAKRGLVQTVHARDFALLPQVARA